MPEQKGSEGKRKARARTARTHTQNKTIRVNTRYSNFRFVCLVCIVYDIMWVLYHRFRVASARLFHAPQTCVSIEIEMLWWNAFLAEWKLNWYGKNEQEKTTTNRIKIINDSFCGCIISISLILIIALLWSIKCGIFGIATHRMEFEMKFCWEQYSTAHNNISVHHFFSRGASILIIYPELFI